MAELHNRLLEVDEMKDKIIDTYLDGCNAMIVERDGKVVVSCPEEDYEFDTLDQAVEMMAETIAIWESEI